MSMKYLKVKIIVFSMVLWTDVYSRYTTCIGCIHQFTELHTRQKSLTYNILYYIILYYIILYYIILYHIIYLKKES